MDTDVNVKQTDKHHRSIDVAACCGGYVDTARLLVYNGADVKRISIAKDNNSNSALDCAMDDC